MCPPTFFIFKTAQHITTKFHACTDKRSLVNLSVYVSIFHYSTASLKLITILLLSSLVFSSLHNFCISSVHSVAAETTDKCLHILSIFLAQRLSQDWSFDTYHSISQEWLSLNPRTFCFTVPSTTIRLAAPYICLILRFIIKQETEKSN